MAEQKPWFVTHKFSFCAVPKAFFSQPRYQKLSTDAKLLYALLLDRASLSYSHREKWTDGQQRIYIVFSQAEIAQKLNCGHDKATKVMRELEQAGLVRRGPQRRGQTARIYVLPFDKVCGKTASVNAENPQQPLRENRTAHCGKTAGKDPEEYPEEYAPHTGRDEICRRIRENIAYDILKDELPVAKLDMIVSVMTELACQQAPSVRIGDRTRQRDELNAQILSMDDMSIRYVCDVLENTRVPIQSPRNYIRAILSNATEGFIECYYDSRVNHDLGALPIQKKP